MRKILTLGAITVALALPAGVWAVGNHPMAGCGLAYVIFQNNQRGPQILASTTNGIFGNQVFGITFGTLGCTEEGLIVKGEELETFAEINLEHLRFEMPKGDGAFVSAFAALMGAEIEEVPVLLSFFKEEYTSLFATPETSSQEMLIALTQKLQELPELLS